MSYAKNLREQVARVGLELQSIVDTAKNENNRGLTSEEREKFHKLESDYTALEDSVKIAEKSYSVVEDLAKPQTSAITETQIEAIQDEFRINPKAAKRKSGKSDQVFSKFLRQGEKGLNADDKALMIKNTMSTTTGSQGGYVVPQGFSDMLAEAKKWFGGIEGTVEKFETSTGNPMPWPTINDTTNKGRIIGQNVQVTETDLVFGQVTFNAYIGSSDLVLVPLALIEDSYFDLDALIARLLGTRLGRLYNYMCTVGTGTNQPTGIVTAAIAAANVVTAGGSTSSGEIASLTYNDLVNLEGAVDPSYRNNPSTNWMFPDAVLKILKKLVDSAGRPLWQPGLTASFQVGANVEPGDFKPKILDHPYVINQDMAVPAASAYSMLFGDMSTFKVREVSSGIQLLVLKERYADYLQSGFTAFERFDSNLVDSGTHPVAVLQQSAT